MHTVNVGLAAWIIQDGNYKDFVAGGSYQFALEFYPKEIAAAEGDLREPPNLRVTEGALHRAYGKVVRVAPSSWVIDFGVPAYEECLPPRWAQPDLGVIGLVYVGVDPFSYFENLRKEPGMPNLMRDWRVRRILLETTPRNESTSVTGPTLMAGVDVSPTFVEVGKTDAWHDDGGYAHYVLECEPAHAG